MTFYIPPVFLFGNKVRHNQEEKKSEYKTAAETEIKVENWNIKRIAELEEENIKLKERIDILYEFIERNDKLVDEVIDEEDLDKLNRYIYIDDDLVDRSLESEN